MFLVVEELHVSTLLWLPLRSFGFWGKSKKLVLLRGVPSSRGTRFREEWYSRLWLRLPNRPNIELNKKRKAALYLS